MIEKMKCIVVDDDRTSVELIKDICSSSLIAEITQTFHSPLRFVDTISKVDFDLCLIKYGIPGMDRVSLLQKLTGRNFIFITNVEEKLKEALNLIEPIDVIPKPIRKERLNKGLETAHRIIGGTRARKEFELFNIAEGNGKIKIHSSDIVFVSTYEADHRNKCVILKDGGEFTLMDCTLEELLKFAPSLIRVNKSELISTTVFHKVEYDVITLKGLGGSNKQMQVTLSRVYRKDFMRRFSLQ